MSCSEKLVSSALFVNSSWNNRTTLLGMTGISYCNAHQIKTVAESISWSRAMLRTVEWFSNSAWQAGSELSNEEYAWRTILFSAHTSRNSVCASRGWHTNKSPFCGSGNALVSSLDDNVNATPTTNTADAKDDILPVTSPQTIISTPRRTKTVVNTPSPVLAGASFSSPQRYPTESETQSDPNYSDDNRE